MDHHVIRRFKFLVKQCSLIVAVEILALLISATPSVLGQSFALSGSQVTGRYMHTASLLSNGKTLIVGGIGNGAAVIANCVLYDPATGTFSATGSLGTGRLQHTATVLRNGKVLIVGGNNEHVALASAELYDPTTGFFTPTGNLQTARYAHTATLLRNGSVLITGGTSVGTGRSIAAAELYNPSTGTFSPSGNLNLARDSHTATLLNDGSVLIAGGEKQGSQLPGAAEIFNPSTLSFALVGNLHQARYLLTATLLSNGSVLIAGGATASQATASAELYNPSSRTFSTTGNLITGRYDQTATQLSDGTVLLAGGVDPQFHLLASAEVYNPANGSFSSTGSMSVARQAQTATLLSDGRVLVVGGGQGATGIASSEIYTYPITNGSVDPKYIVLAVAFAPPGARSSVSYGTSTLLGTSSSIQDSFTNATSVSVTTGISAGIFGTGVNVTQTASTSYSQEADTSSSVSVNKTTTNGLSVPGPQSSAVGVDHDYDIVFVWLNPKVNLTIGSSPSNLLWGGYSFNTRDPINDMDVIGLYVFCLKNPSSKDPGCTANRTRLARTWDRSGLGGLTSADFTAILARDPFAKNALYNPNNDSSGRFDLQPGQAINYEPPPSGGQPFTQTYTASYQETTIAGQAATDTYQVGFTIDASSKTGFIADIGADLKSSNTSTWVNKWSTTTTDTTG